MPNFIKLSIHSRDIACQMTKKSKKYHKLMKEIIENPNLIKSSSKLAGVSSEVKYACWISPRSAQGIYPFSKGRCLADTTELDQKALIFFCESCYKTWLFLYFSHYALVVFLSVQLVLPICLRSHIFTLLIDFCHSLTMSSFNISTLKRNSWITVLC